MEKLYPSLDRDERPNIEAAIYDSGSYFFKVKVEKAIKNGKYGKVPGWNPP